MRHLVFAGKARHFRRWLRVLVSIYGPNARIVDVVRKEDVSFGRGMK